MSKKDKKNKGSNNKNNLEEEKQKTNIDDKELLQSINQYLQINEPKMKDKEKEEKLQNEEFNKIQISSSEVIDRISALKEENKIEELLNLGKEIVTNIIIQINKIKETELNTRDLTTKNSTIEKEYTVGN